ncbi:hypothetical protein KW843_07420 [Acidovorax sp. sif1233]|nr:hypothetical protein [Acidovorax sp. sif1233]
MGPLEKFLPDPGRGLNTSRIFIRVDSTHKDHDADSAQRLLLAGDSGALHQFVRVQTQEGLTVKFKGKKLNWLTIGCSSAGRPRDEAADIEELRYVLGSTCEFLAK